MRCSVILLGRNSRRPYSYWKYKIHGILSDRLKRRNSDKINVGFYMTEYDFILYNNYYYYYDANFYFNDIFHSKDGKS